jgi:hypothetical protein
MAAATLHDRYLKHSDGMMLSLFACMDNAHAAEKMFDWANVGKDNPAWVEGPYISGGANGHAISREQPYCLRVSKEFASLVGYQLGPNPKMGKGGGAWIDNDSDRTKSTTIIPTTAVCVQFAILEAYECDEFDAFRTRLGIADDDKRVKRYDRRPIVERMGILADVQTAAVDPCLVNAYKSVANMRNVLTHEPEYLCDSAMVAFDVYGVCQAIAYALAERMDSIGQNEQITHRKPYWAQRVAMFTQETDF